MNPEFCSIAADVRLGANVQIFRFVNLYGCTIGDNTKIGTFVEIQRNAVIGRDCKISSHTFICEGVTIGDGCFVGHNVVFTNDKHPAAVNEDGSMKSEADWNIIPTVVGNRVSVGSGAVILCGITIGDGAMIGAGAVVTRNVAPGETVAGVPAKVLYGRK